MWCLAALGGGAALREVPSRHPNTPEGPGEEVPEHQRPALQNYRRLPQQSETRC